MTAHDLDFAGFHDVSWCFMVFHGSRSLGHPGTTIWSSYIFSLMLATLLRMNSVCWASFAKALRNMTSGRKSLEGYGSARLELEKTTRFNINPWSKNIKQKGIINPRWGWKTTEITWNNTFLKTPASCEQHVVECSYTWTKQHAVASCQLQDLLPRLLNSTPRKNRQKFQSYTQYTQ